MSRAYSDIAFTPAVRAVQTRLGSRSGYEPLDHTGDRRNRLSPAEVAFIEARDGFYQATVSESGWPYVQFRGGPAGFLKVLDEGTLGYADFRGNVQYISVGNLEGNSRISIILMDYANRRRLKILGRARLVNESDDPQLVARLELAHYRARVERAVVIDVEGYDWNCPQHITPRFTDAEVQEMVSALRAEIAQLRAGKQATGALASTDDTWGSGVLPLRISGIRELTPRVRVYELSATDASPLPPVQAGAHLDVPVQLPSGAASTRRYSIAAFSQQRQAYEIAVLREDAGRGGSAAVHDRFRIGQTLHCGLPGNDFALHADHRPALLIAGGIGITPIQAMAQQLRVTGRSFELHYAARSAREAAYLPQLQEALGPHLHFHGGSAHGRLDVGDVLARAVGDAVIYVCGPVALINAVRAAAAAAGISSERVRSERFLADARPGLDKPLSVRLARSGIRVDVAQDQTILEALEVAGVTASAGCRNGSCGTCRVKVLGGEPDHRDAALTPDERTRAGLMCICVSRSHTNSLTLDL